MTGNSNNFFEMEEVLQSGMLGNEDFTNSSKNNEANLLRDFIGFIDDRIISEVSKTSKKKKKEKKNHVKRKILTDQRDRWEHLFSLQMKNANK